MDLSEHCLGLLHPEDRAKAAAASEAALRGGPRYELLLLDARIAEALGEPARARESVRQAIAEAGAQEALWPQLIATTALCERTDASEEDARSLSLLLDRLTEGLDTAPVARARALLRRAAPALC